MGNTGTSWEDNSFSDSGLHEMADRAMANCKAERGQANQASLHTIAYVLALGELRTWRLADRLERIAQALEANLRRDTLTTWQVLDIVHHWAIDWERKRLEIPTGKRAPVDIIEVSYTRKTGQWKSFLYSDTTKEVFELIFTLDEDFQLQMLSIDLPKDETT